MMHYVDYILALAEIRAAEDYEERRAGIPPRPVTPFLWPALVTKLDIEAVIFSLKCFAAAMLAFFISLRIGLVRPFWTIGTVYIVSQPLAAAAISRSLFRFIGTVAGGIATVALVPTFANEPMVLSAALACWMGLCLYLTLLDRTPRSYAFLQAGITTSLIGFPSVDIPGQVFTTAAMRVQEIAIGIACATVAHGFILPRNVSNPIRERIQTILTSAENLTLRMLNTANHEDLAMQRARLIPSLLELHQLSALIPFDISRVFSGVRVLRLLHDRMLAGVLLSDAIENSLTEMRRPNDDAPSSLSGILNRLHIWFSDPHNIASEQETAHILAYLHESRVQIIAGSPLRPALQLDNVISNISSLVSLHHDCRVLQQNFTSSGQQNTSSISAEMLEQARGYLLHRDGWSALRTSARSAIGITLGCWIWIWSTWRDGATALSIMGAICMLSGASNAPVIGARKYLIGSAYGVVLGLLYGFAILPHTTDFVSLVAVLLPALLLCGSLQARPLFTLGALGTTLTFPIVSGLGPTNASNFGDAINSGIALLIGTGMTIISASILQTTNQKYVRKRIVLQINKDIIEQVKCPDINFQYKTNIMLDRIGLLLPQLGEDVQSCDLLRNTMARIRIAYNLGKLMAMRENPALRLYFPAISNINKLISHVILNKQSYFSKPLKNVFESTLEISRLYFIHKRESELYIMLISLDIYNDLLILCRPNARR